MRQGACGLAAALSLAILGSQVSPAAERPDLRRDSLDAWLTAHPTVADQVIWEFPPTTPIRVPPKRFIVWAAPSVPHPDPGPLLPLTNNVLPDQTFRSTPGTGLTGATLLDVQTPLLSGDVSVSPVQLPGHVPDWLPGGTKTSEYGAEIRAWSKWPDSAKAELRARFAAYDQ